MNTQEIDAVLYALTGDRVRVRVCYGADPVYVVGVLREAGGVYTLDNDGRKIVRFTLNQVYFAQLAGCIIELKEGEGDYWPEMVKE